MFKQTTARLLKSLAAAVAVLASAPGLAATLYGIEFDGVTPIYTVNQTTGALTMGPSTGRPSIGDLASTGGTDILAVDLSANVLFRFNPLTGGTNSSVAISGTNFLPGTQTPQRIVSIAYDTAAGRVYGTTDASYGGVNGDLYGIDPTTGTAVRIGATGLGSLYGLAFNAADGQLYGTTGGFSGTNRLYRINPLNAVATLIAGLTSTANFDLAFRPGDNVLFMSSSGNAALYTVDPLTGASTLVGPFGGSANIAGLAFTETTAIPLPPSVALFLAGAGVFGWAARRNRATRAS